MKSYWLLGLIIFIAGCTQGLQSTSDSNDAVVVIPSKDSTISIPNQGGSMEGHTPRGFQGSGTGLFTGDNLNAAFPNGDGVQIFLSFDLSGVEGDIASATLRSVKPQISGTPFQDLGPLVVDEVRYPEFSSSLWNLAPTENADSCVSAASRNDPFLCDVTKAVQRSMDDAYKYAQFRIRHEQASDSDGQQDLTMFFLRNSNTNTPSIFLLEVELAE